MRDTTLTTYPAYASVVLDVSIDRAFDYGIPHELVDQIHRGSRVEVPLRNRISTGYVTELKTECDYPKVKPVGRVLSPFPLLTDSLFALALWIARYYHAPLGDVIKTMLPSSLRGKSQERQQLFVQRAQTRAALIDLCKTLRSRSRAQSAVLDVMLKVEKGMLLTELLERAQVTRSPVDTLVSKGALSLDIVRIDRSPLVGAEYFRTRPKKLGPEQQKSLDSILKALQETRYETHLLHGITGSGKTEVYMQAIDFALQSGRGAIMLVPEIALTPQTVERFRSRFDEKIAILHHRLSHGERHDEWHRLYRGDARIAIGARSAIFCPVKNLGIIIVDEEHESSYKQTDSRPCYNARDVAVVRGTIDKAVVVLGSATPSLESYQNAKAGKYVLSELSVRPDQARAPTIRIIDMADEDEKAGGRATFAGALLDGIRERYSRGEQTILFLNRRGFHTALLCKQCQQTVQCPHCDLALTFHKSDQKLCCHLCGYTLAPPPALCPACGAGETMRYQGVGTQQVEKALYAIFPGLRVLRVDADTTRHKGSHQKLLRDFGSGKADVLVGTQMIAKGLHFPQVTLVGVLNSGASLHIPDFRASETVFQLITQVAGRAGRGDLPGEVLIQTRLPENRTIQLAAEQDYHTFAKEEIEIRRLFQYPPHSKLARVVLSGEALAELIDFGQAIHGALLTQLTPDYEVLPLAPCGYAKIKDQHRYQLILRGPKSSALCRALAHATQVIKQPRSIRVLIDIDPLTTYF